MVAKSVHWGRSMVTEVVWTEAKRHHNNALEGTRG